jgi:hypothetical protein
LYVLKKRGKKMSLVTQVAAPLICALGPETIGVSPTQLNAMLGLLAYDYFVPDRKTPLSTSETPVVLAKELLVVAGFVGVAVCLPTTVLRVSVLLACAGEAAQLFTLWKPLRT